MDYPVLVLDNGACKCRMGMAGTAQPQVVFQNAMAKTKSDTKFAFGSGIERLRNINQLVVRRPLDRGYLINWQLETAIWTRMLEQHLPQMNASETGLLMTEPLLNLPSIQHTTLQIAFEQFGFRSFHAAPAPVFSLYKWAADHPEDAAAQGLSGIVLDAGYSFTHAVPIFDGRVQTPAVRRLRLGGKLLTNLMKEWVSYRSMNLKDESYLVEHIKDQVCYVASDASAEMAKCFPKKKSAVALEVLLPDGVQNIKGIVQDPRDPSVIEAKAQHAAAGHTQPATLHVNNERFMTPEALFCPSDIGVDQAGVCETVSNCLNACHPVFRPLLAQNVLVCGGTSCCPGFKQRLARDLRPLLDADFDVAVNQGQDPANMAWQGASLFAGSPEYARVAVTRAQYQEHGAVRLADMMADM